MVKNLPTNQETQRCGFNPWVEDSLELEMQPALIFLPGKFQGQRSLGGVHKVAKSWTRNDLPKETETWEFFSSPLFKLLLSQKYHRL